uniref:Uncharacterized protein n=1 Tax=Coccidioides posadasii RMSCC 3488 TaxID=454284 RepID=A0A0J6F8Y4_COCPO|nr:hypothetical protein CPAG_02971 [Coccidioides posadasii RMSCC 3488]
MVDTQLSQLGPTSQDWANPESLKESCCSKKSADIDSSPIDVPMICIVLLPYMSASQVCLLERDVIICVLEHNDTEDRILLTFLPVQRIQGVCRRLWKHCTFHSRTLRSTYVYVGIIPSIFGLGYALLLSPFGGLSLDCSGLIIALSAFSVNFKIGLCPAYGVFGSKCSQCGTKIDSPSTHIWCSSVVS